MSFYRNSFTKPAFIKDAGGATAVEVAILMPLFAFMLFAVIEFGIYSWTKVSAENAVNTVSRLAIASNNTAGQNLNDLITQESFGLIDYSQPDNCVCARVSPTLAAAVALPDRTNCGGCGPINNVGGPGDFVVYEILYRYQFVTPIAALITSLIGGGGGGGTFNNELSYYTSTIVRNES